MSDLADLFPHLSPVLREFDQPAQGTDSLGVNESVTDTDVEAYITGLSNRILRPAVTNQSSPLTPEFARNGRAAPSPSASYVEAPDPAAWSQETSTPPAAPPTPRADERVDAPIPPSPGEASVIETAPPSPSTEPSTEPTTPAPTQATTPPDSYDIGGRSIPRSQVEALVQFNQELASNPALRAHLENFYTQRPSAPSPTFPPPQQLPPNPTLPAVPQLTADELADPAVATLYAHLQAQQQQILATQRAAQDAQQTAHQQVVDRMANITNSARAEFQSTFDLNDEIMAKVEQAAVGSQAVVTYMNGMDPITGAPVTPNEYAAVKRALEIGFYAVPEARQLDYERRQARVARDSQRRAKLGGVSGSGGSVSRTPPPAPDARTAMLSEVSEMFNGSWSPR